MELAKLLWLHQNRAATMWFRPSWHLFTLLNTIRCYVLFVNVQVAKFITHPSKKHKLERYYFNTYLSRELNAGVEVPDKTWLPTVSGTKWVILHTLPITVPTKVIRLPDDSILKQADICGEIKVRQDDVTVHFLEPLLQPAEEDSLPGQEERPRGVHDVEHVQVTELLPGSVLAVPQFWYCFLESNQFSLRHVPNFFSDSNLFTPAM